MYINKESGWFIWKIYHPLIYKNYKIFMINKEEVFLYLNSSVDKSGYLKKEIGFSKKFPELYQEFLKVDLSEELK